MNIARLHLLALLGLLVYPMVASAAPTLVPGRGLEGFTMGDVTVDAVLGADAGALAGALGIELAEGGGSFNSSSQFTVESHTFVVNHGQLLEARFVLRDLSEGVQVGDKVLPPSATFEQVRATLPGCGEVKNHHVWCMGHGVKIHRDLRRGPVIIFGVPKLIDLRGRWQVRGAVFTRARTFSADDARTHVGRYLDFGANAISFGTEVCRTVTPKRTLRDLNRYLAGFKVSPDRMGLKSQSAAIFETGCPGMFLDGFVVVGDRILLYAGGVFFIAERFIKSNAAFKLHLFNTDTGRLEADLLANGVPTKALKLREDFYGGGMLGVVALRGEGQHSLTVEFTQPGLPLRSVRLEHKLQRGEVWHAPVWHKADTCKPLEIRVTVTGRDGQNERIEHRLELNCE